MCVASWEEHIFGEGKFSFDYCSLCRKLKGEISALSLNDNSNSYQLALDP